MQITNLLNPTSTRLMETHQRALEVSLHRLSTGKRINRAADDPAGVVAVEPMKAQRLSVERKIQRLEIESLTHATRDGYLNEHSDLLTRLAGIVTQAGGRDLLSDEEKQALQIEVDSILEALSLNATTAEFQGTALLTGFGPQNLGRVQLPSPGLGTEADGVSLEALLAERAGPAIAVDGNTKSEEPGAEEVEGDDPSMAERAATVVRALEIAEEQGLVITGGLSGEEAGPLSLADLGSGGRLNLIDGDLELAQESVDKAIDQVSTYRGSIGARMKEIDHERNVLQAEFEGLNSAIGQIEDTDYATETAALVRAQMLRETSMRAQVIAHDNAEKILDLIRPQNG